MSGYWSEAKPKSSRRVASAYMFDESSTTATSDTPPRVAEATRHGPALCVYPVLIPFAPRPIPVTDRMITVDQMYLKDAAAEPLERVL